MGNRELEYIIMYIIFEEYYLYESRNDGVSILFGGMLPILSNKKIESMAPSYLFDWNKVYNDNENSTFFQRVNKYLEEYSNKINNPIDVIDLMKFM